MRGDVPEDAILREEGWKTKHDQVVIRGRPSGRSRMGEMDCDSGAPVLYVFPNPGMMVSRRLSKETFCPDTHSNVAGFGGERQG
jgi:hypothetical protein